MKSLPELLDIYRKSVGRNAVLLLNIPPDRRGLFAPPDVARLAEFGAAVREYYETDVSLPGTVNVIDLREDIAPASRSSPSPSMLLLDGEWTQIAAGTTIGHRRLLPLDEPLSVSAVRARILSSRAEATVSVVPPLRPDHDVPLPGVEPGTRPSEGRACIRHQRVRYAAT